MSEALHEWREGPPQPLRIAYVATIAMTVRFLLMDCLLYLQERGHSVLAVCSPGQWLREVRCAGVPTCAVPMNRTVSPLADLRALKMLAGLFRRQHFDVVHTHTPKANLLGRLAACLSGVPVVCGTEHGFYFSHMSGPRRRFHRFWSRCGARCSDVTFLVNEEDIETAHREHVAPPHKLRYLQGGTGIDLDRYTLRGSRAKTRRSLGIGINCPVVGIVARLTHEKGYLEFLQAAALVLRTYPDAQFLSIGPADAAHEGELLAVASQLGICHAVHFLGLRLDMPDLYEAMDIVALPSHREGMPTTLMEAAAMERPVVATDIRGCRDVVCERETGLLVPLGSPEALGSAMVELLSDSERRRKMGTAARRRAELVFDQRRVFSQLETVYYQLSREKGIR
jgi:glycosyltransferase involved in cell wall biosynthesis